MKEKCYERAATIYLEDALSFAKMSSDFRASCAEKDSMLMARASIVFICLYTESCINCCIESLYDNDDEYKEKERLSWKKKLQIFLSEKNIKAIDLEQCDIAHLMMYRNKMVHNKRSEIKCERISSDCTHMPRENDEIGLPKAVSHIHFGDAKKAIGIVNEFFCLIFQKEMKMSPRDVADLLMSRRKVQNITDQNKPLFDDNLYFWLKCNNLLPLYVDVF